MVIRGLFSSPDRRCLLARWLFLCCGLLVLLIAIGGATRLTHSGLSIPSWRPLTGALPPIGAGAWERAFAEYRETPEYRIVRRGMTPPEFRGIYLWEYVHRLVARLLGLAFVVPLGYFAWRGWIPHGAGRSLASILGLGLLQGGVGWWMVASGLVSEPRVSHHRLAIHLGLALVLLGAMLRTGVSLIVPARPRPTRAPARWFAWAIAGAVFLQAIAGALMAGSRAGLLFPTFPLMAGELVPARLFALRPWPRSLVDDLVTIHFVHRWLGMAIAACSVAALLANRTRPADRPARRWSAAVALLAATTAGFGVVTVASGVALLPAAGHQTIAVALFGAAIVTAHLGSGGLRSPH